jgi:trimeric autotransporter adhesin
MGAVRQSWRPAISRFVPAGVFEVTKQLPGNGEREYRIKSANGTAIGTGAVAAFAGSTAIGAGAVTTAPNQMVFGTGSSTYVAPGITSAASKAAQSGPLQIVTSDAGGNLATNTAAGLGLASSTDISALNSQIAGINNQIVGINTRLNDLDGRTTKALNGVAMAFAISGVPWLQPTERFAVSANYGTFQGTNGIALNGALRLSTRLQAEGGIAYGANGGGVGGRAGLRMGW